MANERQELDRLRKLKRLRELEAKTTIKGVQNDIPTNGLGTPSANGLATEQVRPRAQVAPQGDGFLSSVGEFFTGSERETEATKRLPEIGSGGLLFGEDKAKTAADVLENLFAIDAHQLFHDQEFFPVIIEAGEGLQVFREPLFPPTVLQGEIRSTYLYASKAVFRVYKTQPVAALGKWIVVSQD